MLIRFRIGNKSTALIGGLAILVISAFATLLIVKGLGGQSYFTADDFFVRLIENKADLTKGYATYEIKNPLDFDIVVDNNILKTRIENQPDATPITSLKTFVLKSVDYSERLTDYSYECNPYNITDINGTTTYPNCTKIISGWHWSNYTKDEWHELSSETFKPGNVYKIKIEATWLPKIGLNSREWFPQININGMVYEQTKWAWWNTSYPYRYKIISNTTNVYPISVNDTQGVNGTIFWALIDNNSYVYSDQSCSNQPCGNMAIANDTTQKNWENTTARIGNNPTSVYDNNYLGWWHLDEGTGTVVDDSTSNDNNATTDGSDPAWNSTHSKFGYALKYIGTDEKVADFGDVSAFELENFTIEIWVYPEDLSTFWNVFAMQWQGQSAGGDCGVLISTLANSSISTAIWGGTDTYQLNYGSGLELNKWSYIVLVKDGTTMKIYLNGTLDITRTVLMAVDYTHSTTQKTTLGASWMGVAQAYGSEFKGLVDELRISNIARDEAYIRTQYWNGINNLTRLGSEEALLLVDQRINDIECEDSKCVLYQSDQAQLIANIEDTGSPVNASNISATIYLKNTSAPTGWTQYQLFDNASFARIGDGKHVVNFTVNNTLGEYKSVAQAEYSDKYDSDTDYFNVSYAWWDKAWSNRKVVNITETSGTNIPFGININFGSDTTLNCTREIRVVNYTWDGSETNKPENISVESQVYNESYSSNSQYCIASYISWNFNASNNNQTYFIYYGNPIAEIPSYRVKAFNFVVGDAKDTAEVNFDSHADFVWFGSNFTVLWSYEWNQSTLSKYRRINTNETYNTLVDLDYKPRVSTNRHWESVLDTLPDDKIYWFNGHGSIINNETSFSPNGGYVSASDIDGLSGLSARFVELASCYSGENDQTNSNLTGWFGKSFIEKGTDCFLGFQGKLTESTHDPTTGEVLSTPFPDFNKCFWDNITTDVTIRDAKTNCDIYGAQVAPMLYNKTIEDECDQTLR